MYPNGLESQFTYDTLNRVTAMNAAKASYSYTLSPTGNRTGAVESSGRTLNWSYDGIYRLTNETISLDPHSVNGSVSYGLDPVGNRQSQTSSIPGIATGSFTYDADDRLNTETYDANGNTLTSAGKTFTYGFENRLKSMTAGSVAVTIQYDADGNRVAKTVNGVTTRYLVDDLNPTGYAQVVEEVTAGAVIRQYTYGLQRISQTQQIANAWTPSFYGYDGGGTVRLLTDSTGTVTDTYDYDAWGNAVNTTGSTPNVYLYRGEQNDPDLSFYYLRARYYNPLSGRLLSTDPEASVITDPSTLHRYFYATADPVNRVDPSGRVAGLLIWDPTFGYLAFSFGPLAQVKVAIPRPGECGASGAGPGGPGGGLSGSGGLDPLVADWLARKPGDPNGGNTCGCSSAPPLPSNSPKCDSYGSETYLGVSLKCFCKCAGDSSWSKKARGCLACEHDNHTDPYTAHLRCYKAAGVTSAPWGTLSKCYKQCFVGLRSGK
jgi:RHS repeat-associated protein